MLAKKGWQLLLYDDSLVIYALKAHYFHNFSFLKIDLESNPHILSIILYRAETY